MAMHKTAHLDSRKQRFCLGLAFLSWLTRNYIVVLFLTRRYFFELVTLSKLF